MNFLSMSSNIGYSSVDKKVMKILIIGCGYVGLRAAERWTAIGHQVTALTRSPSRAAQFGNDGFQAIVGDVLDSESLKALPAADICLYAVGYDRSTSADKKQVYVDGLKNVLTEIQNRVPRLVYVSSSSVYGQEGGEVVNELSPCHPNTDGGRICLTAESVVREFYPSVNSGTILRLSGIYGPDRLIGRRQQLESRTPISGNPQGWLNLIHVEDILLALDQLVSEIASSDLYLLSDGNPLRRIEFYSQLANQLQLPAPVMLDAQDRPLGKRCDPSRILDELRLKLLYPTAATGLAASV